MSGTPLQPATMSGNRPAPKPWPPIDLIAGRSLKTIADPESQLDEKVHSGKSDLRGLCSLSLILLLANICCSRDFIALLRSGQPVHSYSM